jgi:hypothetical protein
MSTHPARLALGIDPKPEPAPVSRQLAAFLARHTYEWTQAGARIDADFRNGRRAIIVVADGSLDFALVYRGDDLLGRHTTIAALRRLAADT